MKWTCLDKNQFSVLPSMDKDIVWVDDNNLTITVKSTHLCQTRRGGLKIWALRTTQSWTLKNLPWLFWFSWLFLISKDKCKSLPLVQLVSTVHPLWEALHSLSTEQLQTLDHVLVLTKETQQVICNAHARPLLWILAFFLGWDDFDPKRCKNIFAMKNSILTLYFVFQMWCRLGLPVCTALTSLNLIT